MARIAGVDIPREKRIEISLTYLFGIGRPASNQILSRAGIDPNKRTNMLSEEEVARIREIIEQEHKIEGDLRKEINVNIKRLMDIGCYRGLRHRKGLPVRGQRTRTNSRTRKGPRKTSMKRKK
ncbi:MAG: 30S ribosomal protein S13 [Syntrophorhabdales bacterium]